MFLTVYNSSFYGSLKDCKAQQYMYCWASSVLHITSTANVFNSSTYSILHSVYFVTGAQDTVIYISRMVNTRDIPHTHYHLKFNIKTFILDHLAELIAVCLCANQRLKSLCSVLLHFDPDIPPYVPLDIPHLHNSPKPFPHVPEHSPNIPLLCLICVLVSWASQPMVYLLYITSTTRNQSRQTLTNIGTLKSLSSVGQHCSRTLLVYNEQSLLISDTHRHTS